MADRSLLGSSAVMAAGTVFSRMSGFIRSVLLAAALGVQLHADAFNIANTIPNMLYILLAGGVFNAVLVPQLVRAMKKDADGGEAFTSRIVTVAGLFLAGVTAVLVICAPLLMQLFLDGSWNSPELAAQKDSAIDFARWCLPQVFFYGMFVLVGQVLNARGSFGPMMWAPILNNAIAIATLVTYLLVYGGAVDVCANPEANPTPTNSTLGPFSTGQEVLLGLGSTIGIVAQLLVLVPYLRRAGFHFKPRLDLRGSGLGHTFRLGLWTVAFVIVNQIAYTVVVRLASAGTATAATCAEETGTGYTVYSTAFLFLMVPHSIATVSLATAMLPRLSGYAAEGRLEDVGRGVAEVMRTTYALILPFAALLPVVAFDLANVLWSYAAAADAADDIAPTLSLFGIGLVFFTSHYLVLRGFYALERTRTTFWIQCVIAAVNILLALLLTRSIDPAQTAPRLVLAYTGAYAVGALVSYVVLARIVGGLETRDNLRFAVRMVMAVGLSAAAAAGAGWLVDLAPFSGKIASWISLAAVGSVYLAGYLLLARVMRITEVTSMVSQVVSGVTRRVRPKRA